MFCYCTLHVPCHVSNIALLNYFSPLLALRTQFLKADFGLTAWRSSCSYRYGNRLLNTFLVLHGHCSWMCLWLVTDILLKLVRWPRWLALHCSKATHWLSLSHTSYTLAWTSRPRLLLLHSPGRYLTDASCPWNLPTTWHLHSRRSHLLLLLHRLPTRTHLLHLGCKEWTLASLGRTTNKPFNTTKPLLTLV